VTTKECASHHNINFNKMGIDVIAFLLILVCLIRLAIWGPEKELATEPLSRAAIRRMSPMARRMREELCSIDRTMPRFIFDIPIYCQELEVTEEDF
jgi:hypothetical protein